MRLFQFAVFNVGVRRAAGGKFNGRLRRNAPRSFIINGKCDEMRLTFSHSYWKRSRFPGSPSAPLTFAPKNLGDELFSRH